jgi:hypothetical protein
VTKYTNKILLSDSLLVMEGAVSDQYKSIGMMTVMRYLLIHPTA